MLWIGGAIFLSMVQLNDTDAGEPDKFVFAVQYLFARMKVYVGKFRIMSVRVNLAGIWLELRQY